MAAAAAPHWAFGDALLPLAHPDTFLQGGAFLQQQVPAAVRVPGPDAGSAGRNQVYRRPPRRHASPNPAWRFENTRAKKQSGRWPQPGDKRMQKYEMGEIRLAGKGTFGGRKERS